MLLRGCAPLRLHQVQVLGRGQEPSPHLFVPVAVAAAAAGKVHQQEALRPAAAGSSRGPAQGLLQEHTTTTTAQVRVVAFHYISPPSSATAKLRVVAFRHGSLPTSSST